MSRAAVPRRHGGGRHRSGRTPSFWPALALAALPALGDFAGGVLAEPARVCERTPSLALRSAAGIVLAVVGLEPVPEALVADLPWVPLSAFVVGAEGFAAVATTRRAGIRRRRGDDLRSPRG